MFVIANFLSAFARILDVALSIYMWIIVARAVLSWVNVDPRNPIVNLLYQITDPLLWRIRQFLPLRGLGIDVSPIIAILAIYFLQRFVVATLFDIASRM